VYQTFVIRAEHRDALQRHLAARGVDSKVHYPTPLHLQEAAADLGYKKGDFPVTERLAGNNYYRMIVSGEKIVGAQSVGDAKDMGALLYALIKRENLSKINHIIEDKPLPMNPLYHRAARSLALQSIKE